MCGILGKINFSSKLPVTEAELSGPLSALLHRGPDDFGVMADKHCGLAMRRLKIIDLEGGHQPIYNEDGTLAIILNGEIYNYKELRRDLEPKHRFKTSSDTEVILHLYEEFGEACLEKLNGMFAFALWNSQNNELFIARDRTGIKPLFYSEYNGTLYFASEIKALLAFKELPRDLDHDALTNYLSFYYISAPHTIYKHIRRLPQGHYLKVRDGKTETQQYWNYQFRPNTMSLAEAKQELETALFNSVKRQLVSEVPLGVFLSSGLDSTAITAMMSKLGIRPNTYTVGYENGGTYNELDEARLVAKKYNTKHHDCIFSPAQLIDCLPKIIAHLAEPHGDWTQAAIYYLSNQSRTDITVALSGVGGDELFGGYPTLVAAKFGNLYRQLPGPVKTSLKKAAGFLPVSHKRLSLDFKIKSFVRGADAEPEMAHLKYKEIFSAEEINLLLYGKSNGDSFKVYKDLLPSVKNEELLNRLLYLDLNVFMPYCALHATDMTTMMNSQEARVPFLDNELIDFSETLPINMKVSGLTTKYLMRKAFKQYLPEEILKMPKKGLNMPTPFWLRKELKDFARGIISRAEKSPANEVINIPFARQVMNEHLSGKRDNTRRLTCLLSLFLWFEQYQK